MIASPITGSEGNREFLLHLVRGAEPAATIHDRIAEVCAA